MKQRNLALFILLTSIVSGNAQDTLQEVQLTSHTVRAYRRSFTPAEVLPPVSGTYLYAGKRSEVISIDRTAASVPEKSVRQVFAKIPGAFAYDMDGSGNQINLALRGLDPHRSWDMNVRQNQVVLNSDLYGYPASHYSPPLESIERIELVRGTASLQYGAMFGGMLNYVTRRPDTTKTFSIENQSAIGSFGQLSTFNSVGGRSGKVTWQSYYYRRAVDGYRNDSRSTSEAQFASVEWQVSDQFQIKAEVARSTYRFQIPGPLTDSMAQANPKISTRQRNYYSPDILIPSLTLRWELDEHTQFEWITSHLTGDRSSVQFLGAADRLDTINRSTGRYQTRQVDIDLFNSTTSELRLRRNYHIKGKEAVLVTGLRYIHNDLNRRQLGKGTDGSNYDLTLTDPQWGRDLRYQTNNVAFFIENAIWISPALSVMPGFRIEHGLTLMRGEIRSLPPDRAVTDIDHRFGLFGCNIEYKPAPHIKLYGGIAQAYRPVVLGEIIPVNILEQVDPDLRDSRGYNAEIGISGNFLHNHLTLNASVFQLAYNDRIGSQAFEDAQGNTFFLKKNIGDSRTNGLELYAELAPVKTDNTYLSLFTATAWMSGKYLNGELASGTENVSLKGNNLESVPEWTSRNGVQCSWKRWSASVQYSYVGKTFSDPLNTPVPTSNGTRGPVPAYGLWDAQLGVQITPEVKIRVSGNNLGNLNYFTKRPVIYPGPGVWPSDGRGWTATVIARL